ncbi:MAG TPA: hypothetical protein VFJ90_15865 [Candidatus Didemnitutus sp.]|nr:hypothetical protein [Candidatus Didemnitutus sp.]
MNVLPPTRFPWIPWLLAAMAAALSFSLDGCYQPTPGHVSVAATEVIGADDYVYYPGSEVYYSPAHRYYVYYDHGAWVHHPTPPRVWVREAPSVTVHLRESPQYHHPEVVRQYPHNWRPPPKPNEKDHRDHDGNRDHDHDQR